MTKTKKYEHSPIELMLSTIDKVSEKQEFMVELSTQFDEFFVGKSGKVLLYTSSDRNKIEEDKFHHMSIYNIKKYYLEDISSLYDKINFNRIDIEHRSDSELNIVFWKPCSESSSNGYSVYIRYISDEEYDKILNDIANLNICKIDKNIQNYYCKILQESYWKVSIEDLQKKVLNRLNSLIREILYKMEGDLNEYCSLKDNDVLELIQNELEESNDETYILFKKLIKYNYESSDCIKFLLNGEVFFSFKRVTNIQYNFEYE